MNERTAELCAKFADGVLSEAESAELLALADRDAEVAEALTDELELHRQLEISAGVFPIDDQTNAERILYYIRAQNQTAEFSQLVGERIRKSQQRSSAPKRQNSAVRRPSSSKRRRIRSLPRASRQGWMFAALAASIAVAAYFVLRLQQPAQPDAQTIGRIVQIVPAERPQLQPILVRNGESLEALADAPLRVGDRIESQGSTIQIGYLSDSSVIEMHTDTVVTFDSVNDDKTVRLAQGELEGTIAKQPVGKPMRFLTSGSEATVLGTRLALSANAAQSQLEVIEGSVQFAQGTDQKVMVTTGEFAVATPGQQLVVQKVEPAPEQKTAATDKSARPMPWRINPLAQKVLLSWQNVPELKRDLVRVEYTNEVDNRRAIISKPFTSKPGAKQLHIRMAFVSFEPNLMLSVMVTGQDGSIWYVSYHKPGMTPVVPWTDLVISLTKRAKKMNTLGGDHLDPDQIKKVELGFSRGKSVVLLDEITAE